MNYKLNIFIILFFTVISNELSAQNSPRFSSGVAAYFNAAQIDGDEIAGFNRFGYTVGAFGRARLKKNMDLGLEIKYSTRGSRYGKNDPPIVNIGLKYIEVPVLFIIKDWLKEDEKNKFYKMEFLGGLSAARLISSSSLNNIHPEFKKFDLSWTAGFSYFTTKHFAYAARYTRSFTPVYSYEKNGQNIRLISYFISLGLEYKF